LIERRFAHLWATLAPIGRDPATGGYLRYAWSPAELACRQWFAEQASQRTLSPVADGNGNLFAWWGSPEDGDAVLTGSHFDSVPHGGGYDGPLGIVSALLAIDLLRERGVTPRRPIGIAAFVEEEGSRFGVACLGSRLLTGAMDPATAGALADRDGITLLDAMAGAGAPTDRLGADQALLSRIGAFVELHLEQGRELAQSGSRDRAEAVGVASAIWPHGRWRLDFAGEPNHAGTTVMGDRHDPMLTLAYTVLAANKEARLRGVRATIGRVSVEPNATNAIPSRATAWLDARAPSAEELDALVSAVTGKAAERARRDGTTVAVTAESRSPETRFDAALRDRLSRTLKDAPILPTGAGHDAGVLAEHVPAAMLFVRNPTGVSHAPGEYATDVDCAAGVVALADVLEELACRP
jgi:beta-ureidopropionase / N-carbamoyl-L-amino-acid hydrolase